MYTRCSVFAADLKCQKAEENMGREMDSREIREVSQRRREQANGVLRIPRSSEYGIESGIFIFSIELHLI